MSNPSNQPEPKSDAQAEVALREKLAAIEHERWADWQKWCNKVLRQELGNNTQIESILIRWDRQINTPGGNRIV